MLDNKRVPLPIKLIDLLAGQRSQKLAWRAQDKERLVAAEDELADLVGRAEQATIYLDGAALNYLITMERVTWFDF